MQFVALVRTFAATGATLALGLALAAPASAQEAPPGNNGTIKIDNVPIDDGNENNPHPGCSFVVDFFGYDVGTRSATLVFDGHAPTGGGMLLTDAFTFEVATRDSGNQLNASRSVDLSAALVGVEPHPKQGWHVKLTVHVDGSQGSDAKHKVFWVSACTAPDLVAAQQGVDARAAAAEATAEQSRLAVQAEQSRLAVLAAQEQARLDQLPMTGAASEAIAATALALITAGVFLVLAGRRRERTA